MDTGHAHARYRELLYQHGHGYPFWVPEPGRHLPAEQRSEGLRLGDVCVLNDDGGFDYLWNIHLPANHPQNRLAPPKSEPVELDPILDVRRTDFFFPRNTAINSTFVKKREINIEAKLGPAIVGGIVGGGGGFEFTAEGNSGAVLALPRGAVRFDSLKPDVYLQHAAKNAEYWYRHINQVLQRGIQSGALYLVTGTDKCSSWGVASFANPNGSDGFTLQFIASDAVSSDVSVKNSWSANFGAEHRENVVDSSELSQCVFARGIVISVRDSFLAQLCGMHVKVTSLDGSRGRPPFVGSNRPYSRGAGSNANIDVRRLPENQPQQRSVAALLGDELLYQNDDALIAIVHDDDWIGSMRSGDFLEARDPGGSFLEDLVHHAATHSRAVVIDGICTFATANLMAPSDGRDGSAVPNSHPPAQANDPTEPGETDGQDMQGKFETARQLTKSLDPHPSFIGPLADALMAYSEASHAVDLTSSLTVDLARKSASGGADKYEDYPENDSRDASKPSVALDIAKDIRESANGLFKAGKMPEALSCYRKAIRYLDFCPLSSLDGDDAQLKGAYEALYAPLLLNAALCALKDGDNESVLNHATRALDEFQLQPTDNVKALYRRALAQSALRDYEAAEHDLVEASALSKDKVISEELEKVRGKMRAQKEQQKAGLRKPFQ